MRPDWAAHDLSWSQRLHRGAARRSVLQFFIVISRLGDGVLWYAVIAGLAWLGGPPGTACALRMTCVGVVNLIIYVALKRLVARPRPFHSHPSIRAGTRPLDLYSFPSGHTLHAVASSVVLAAYFPTGAIAAWVFTALVALSRLVLGLHYPSDVIVGAAIGVTTALLTFSVF